jgi:hypothetical protein
MTPWQKNGPMPCEQRFQRTAIVITGVFRQRLQGIGNTCYGRANQQYTISFIKTLPGKRGNGHPLLFAVDTGAAKFEYQPWVGHTKNPCINLVQER